MTLLSDICSDKVLEEAYLWCCKQRENYSANSDIWMLRQDWQQIKAQLKQLICAREYKFSPMHKYDYKNSSSCIIWCAKDAIVIKALAIVLTKHLSSKLSPSCTHIKGNGGISKAINSVEQNVKRYPFFIRSDVLKFYASINHIKLMQQVKLLIDDKIVVDLISQSIERDEVYRGYFYKIKQGIPLGSALSPLLGAIMLMPLDNAMQKHKVCYVRFMDDWLILSHTRSRLKSAIRLMYLILNSLNFLVHPDKTQMGKTNKGFVFLGFNFSNSSTLSIATITLDKYFRKLCSLVNKSVQIIQLINYQISFKAWCKGILCGRPINYPQYIVIKLNYLC